MNEKTLKINKVIKLEDEVFEVTLESKPNTFASEKIVVDIIMVNYQELHYTYETVKFTSEKDRYKIVIQDALQYFINDTDVNDLIKWDGKLKYKISL